MKRVWLFFLLVLCSNLAFTASIEGKLQTKKGEPLAFAQVLIQGTGIGVESDLTGYFLLMDVPVGEHQIVVSALGYQRVKQTVSIEGTDSRVELGTLSVAADLLGLDEVVVTGTRSAIPRYDALLIVSSVSDRSFDVTQSLSVAEGLSFSPGLRVENNCQNCGFTQLRMNGLEGAYSQVLINSRPVFSALAGVYGLELLPSTMIDRVEVVRGGGSVMYGGNAIAGTVNIITKDPIKNAFEVEVNQSMINGEAPDRTVHFNGSIVSDDLDKGISFFGFNRTRDPWDANGDGFSELVLLDNNTFGFDAFWNLNARNKVKLGAYYINEKRRGGNKFDLFPHQTDVTEQLEHQILSANMSYEHFSANYKHKIAVYGSVQTVDRQSYYGGGGRVLVPGDSLTEDDLLAINAYGTSQDISAVGGLQYTYDISRMFILTTGVEYIYNDVIDEMPGYDRLIDQQVGTLGSYAQLQFTPSDRLTFLLGGRWDQLRVDGAYDLASETYTNERNLSVLVPRLSGMYNITEQLKLRASFAQGYRGPQAFDEDLHIETVGGAARFVRINPDLTPERSNSATLSLNYDKTIKGKQVNLIAEGFYTQLLNPFIFANQTELPNGVAIIDKRNGTGAQVSGVNLEANLALSDALIIQSGATFQTALYDEVEEIWAPVEGDNTVAATTTDRILRTPNSYGYFTITYTPIDVLSLTYSGVITGEMLVPHVIDPETERTVLKTTPSFFENNTKISYTWKGKDRFAITCFSGVQNIFNSYQSDFDRGADRDAGYVYGPLRPRTFFAGITFGMQ